MKSFLAILLAAVLLGACSGEEVNPEVTTGRQLFAEHCAACHSLSEEVVIVGPSLNGVASRISDNDESLTARELIRRAILSPETDLVEGFDDLMPSDFGDKLSDEDLEALVSFLLTLE